MRMHKNVSRNYSRVSPRRCQHAAPTIRIIVMALLFAMCMGAFAEDAYCGGITDAEITQCLIRGNVITCEEVQGVVLGVSPGELNVLEMLTNGGSEEVRLEITKRLPQMKYPLLYRHTVPYYPWEEAICVKRPHCVDAPDATDPTCGWQEEGGERIEGSQGFCCDTTARCLRPGDVTFHGYEIGPARTSYEVKIKIIEGSEEHTFALSPANRGYATEYDGNYAGTLTLKAELLGEFAGVEAPPVLENYMLYVPAGPQGHSMVVDYQNHLLLVPREETSLDGSECNKVGTSYKAFRSQKAFRDTREIGDCLHNQLFQKHNSDLQKLSVNPEDETTYLVHGMRKFKDAMEFKAGMERMLEYSPASDEPSLIALTMDIAELKHIQTESNGIIMTAEIEEFESFSRKGTLKAEIKNVGAYPADYIVTVTKCTMNVVRPNPQKTITLNVDDVNELSFDLYTNYNLDTSNECLVSLKGPHGKTYDKVWVRFDTKKHPILNSGDLLMINQGGTEPECKVRPR